MGNASFTRLLRFTQEHGRPTKRCRAVPQPKALQKNSEPHARPRDDVLEAHDRLVMETSQPEHLAAWPAVIVSLHDRLVKRQIRQRDAFAKSAARFYLAEPRVRFIVFSANTCHTLSDLLLCFWGSVYERPRPLGSDSPTSLDTLSRSRNHTRNACSSLSATALDRTVEFMML